MPVKKVARKTPFSPQEAADFLGLNKRTVLRYIHSGKLSCVKVNARVWRIPAKDVHSLDRLLNG